MCTLSQFNDDYDETTTEMQFPLFPHPSYPPDLAPTDFTCKMCLGHKETLRKKVFIVLQ